ncbi:energy-coupling factor ABC transporter permease [Suttonella sp. R2A3]|uniref:energy-coupling factor ABC transporter permease n=1 Tax=Suttonella sp. R2A3 TaxID=2908648 RepID=UPI001F3C1DC7|nr:energy-coupling factor ABC transporter permease [Suttonella sp. R2A3]UJF24470.1 energy-coupling factor ABC transporter permease [Suttonella sp. R2A3]
MNIDPSLISTPLLYTLLTIWLGITVYAAFSVRWSVLREHPYTIHIFFTVCLALTLLAMMRVGVKPGLSIHLLGLTATTLLMGWRLALLAGMVAQCLLVILGYEPLVALGINGLCQVLAPVAISYGLAHLLHRFLPHNPFIFTLGAGFFGGCFALAAALWSSALLMLALGVYDWQTLWHKYLMFSFVAVYPEGFVNGVFITSMVAFYPRLISAFDPQSYFGDSW